VPKFFSLLSSFYSVCFLASSGYTTSSINLALAMVDMEVLEVVDLVEAEVGAAEAAAFLAAAHQEIGNEKYSYSRRCPLS
jgi:hypothetical protein